MIKTPIINYINQDFLNNYIRSKSELTSVDHKQKTKDIFDINEQNKTSYYLDSNIKYSFNKTIYKGKESVLFCFKIILKGDLSGSSTSSQRIMELINEIYSQFIKITHCNYCKLQDPIEKCNIVYIKIIKTISDDDLF